MIFNLVQMKFVSSFTKIPHSGEKHCGDGDFWVSSMLKLESFSSQGVAEDLPLPFPLPFPLP
jgi:hypothetical protein